MFLTQTPPVEHEHLELGFLTYQFPVTHEQWRF
jgi:hypothetical protein